jgi:hypothetical protein
MVHWAVAAATGPLSLAKERAWGRFDSKAWRISELLTFILSPCGKGRGQKAWDPRRFPRDNLTTSFPAQPNIVWSVTVKNPSNCVFFACNPPAPAVFTS